MERIEKHNWDTEDLYWQDAYWDRPYARAGRDYDYYRPAYRYGYESASRYQGREWKDVESELRSGWERYRYPGPDRSTWDDVKDAVHDAWDHMKKITSRLTI